MSVKKYISHILTFILRYCYQKFARNIERLKSTENEQDQQTRTSTRKKTEDVDKIKFSKDCIFCNKTTKKAIVRNRKKTTDRLVPFKCDNWQNILHRATLLQDEVLLVRIRGYDLESCGAHYHASCKKKYLAKNYCFLKPKEGSSNEQKRLESAHDKAFKEVCKIIDDEILVKKKVFKLSDLRLKYCNILETTEFENCEYRGEKLKDKLTRDENYKDKLEFIKLDSTSKFQSYLVYSKDTDVATLIKNVYTKGSCDNAEAVALKLRETISSSQGCFNKLPWPSTVEAMANIDSIPDELSNFLSLLLTGNSNNLSDKNKRLIHSIGQDICRIVTNGEWKFPKHILLCMTIRHLFRSKELTTLFNRLGHCESYSFALELETAIATVSQQSSSLLCENIHPEPNGPSVFHSEFDNFDQFVNNLSGHGSIHTAHGIMLQDCLLDQTDRNIRVTTVPKTKQRSWWNENAPDFQECYISKRKSPVMKIERTQLPGSCEAFTVSVRKDLTWIVLRILFEGQSIPAWAGFLSTLGETPA